ncbi:hypothetical protein [Bailinhaonella thermotolerans]|uniref:Uncharacterized protein n=1 Tax=Bailinhaonella thermotolerans TaxID=1070861 RepID=A0A3A4ASC4_9ACTN|nr:hypothetical protein [Bailinhaonella thermotolerans]RJL32798.1 hypothetical protein D5H75_15175 [Bailinhaonella thermotolerans]
MDESPMFRSLWRHGLRPQGESLDEVRRILREQTGPEADPWDVDVDVLKLGSVQLFNAGDPADAELIWDAKTAGGMDSFCSIDVQLLCGAGLAETKEFLAGRPDADDPDGVLEWLVGCEAAGDFADFSPAAWSAVYDRYYGEGA